MNWGELLLILVTYCGSVNQGTLATDCREKRITCFKRVSVAETVKNDAVAAISACITDPNYQPPTAPEPRPPVKAEKKKEKK